MCLFFLFDVILLKIMMRVIFGLTVHTLCDSAHTLVSLSGSATALCFLFASFVGVGASPFHLSPLLVGFALPIDTNLCLSGLATALWQFLHLSLSLC